MSILVVTTGEYGRRQFRNLVTQSPTGWMVEEWRAPTLLPPVIDYPADYVPAGLPSTDLILSVAEWPGVAELIPDAARVTGAAAVIAAVDNESWLPRGLARQLRGWLAAMNVACVTPKPLCSLTPSHYAEARGRTVQYDDPFIAAFARRFGRPQFEVRVEHGVVTGVDVVRDSACGCARFVAAELAGVPVGEAAARAGLLHHHYPCLASMVVDADYGDTLMHVSGNLVKDAIAGEVERHQPVRYLLPGR